MVRFFKRVAGPQLAERHVFDQFLEGGRASQPLAQLPGVPLDPSQVVDPAHRRAPRLGRLRQRLENRLANPPDRVGDELEAAFRVEPVDRLQQPHVAFGD